MIIDLIQEKKKALKSENKQLKEAMNSVLNEIRTLQLLQRTEVTVQKQYKWFKRAYDTRIQSSKIYQSNNREDLYNKQIAQANIAKKYLQYLQEFMPKQLTQYEISKIIQNLIDENNVNIGQVMKWFTTNYPTQNKAQVSKVFNMLKNKKD